MLGFKSPVVVNPHGAVIGSEARRGDCAAQNGKPGLSTSDVP